MFKNAAIFHLAAAPSLAAVEDAAEHRQFVACTPTQSNSAGFVPVRGDRNGALVELIAGAWIMCVHIETRTVPAPSLKIELSRLCAEVEQQTDRKPGKAQRAELKEQAYLNLMPRAFSKYTDVLVWIDPASKLLVLDTSSAGCADGVLSLLAGTCDGWGISYVRLGMAPRGLMTAWLDDGAPDIDGFSMGREATLEALDETGTKVVFTDADLDTDEVKAHVRMGLTCMKLGLVWKGRVTFTLSEGPVLRKVEVFEGLRAVGVDAFDADVAIATGELRALIADLFAAHDGIEPESEMASVAP